MKKTESQRKTLGSEMNIATSGKRGVSVRQRRVAKVVMIINTVT